MVVVRFAPSPTGRIHVGNVRTALLNWLFAKGQGGQFVLRIDDTDTERSRDEYEIGIETDLTWLGLTWDRKENQSKRFASYDAAAAKLKAAGLLYACYETEDELERRRKLAMARGRPPVYDRAALSLSEEEKAKLEAEGRKPHWRFKLSGGRVEWDDLVRGPQGIDTASVSDPVLIKGDGSYLYTLPSVVDDIDMDITHVVRGEDHVTNAGVQLEIFKALGAEPPVMAHFPLLVGAEGEALSKRLGSMSIESLREEGVEAIAVLSHLAKLGTSDPVEARASLDELKAEFDFAKIGRAPARFDPEELRRINAQVLHNLPYIAVQGRLAELGADLGADFWEAVRSNLTLLSGAGSWAHVINGPLEPVIEDAAFLAKAAELLPAAPYTQETWGAWTDAVKAATGAKGKTLFLPLRLALTGLRHGPEMHRLLPLIGESKARARLAGQTA